MGVDIHFCAEVRKQEKWQPLVWFTKPSEEEHSCWAEKPLPGDNGMTPHFLIFLGRAYHYRDALEDMNERQGYPDDMSDELRARLPDESDVSSGYFAYTELEGYLENAEKKLLLNLLQSREYQLVEQLNRIENAVLGKPVEDQIESSYLSNYSIEQIYEEYDDDVWNLNRLRHLIYYLADEIADHTREEDIRIIYFMG